MQENNQNNQGRRGMGKGGGRGICRQQPDGTAGMGRGLGNKLGRNTNAGSGRRCGMRTVKPVADESVKNKTTSQEQQDKGATDASE